GDGPLGAQLVRCEVEFEYAVVYPLLDGHQPHRPAVRVELVAPLAPLVDVYSVDHVAPAAGLNAVHLVRVVHPVMGTGLVGAAAVRLVVRGLGLGHALRVDLVALGGLRCAPDHMPLLVGGIAYDTEWRTVEPGVVEEPGGLDEVDDVEGPLADLRAQ